MIRPDPKEIGRNLAQYYPGHVSAAAQQREKEKSEFHPLELMSRMPILLAMVANSSGQANMSIVMVLTSLILQHHGYSLSAIAVSHVFHSAGMFAFTVPLGMLLTGLARQIVMYTGVAVALVRCGAGHILRQLYRHYARHVSGRPWLGGGQCVGDRA